MCRWKPEVAPLRSPCSHRHKRKEEVGVSADGNSKEEAGGESRRKGKEHFKFSKNTKLNNEIRIGTR